MVQLAQLSGTVELRDMPKMMVSSGEARDLLGLKSTQAVRDLIAAGKLHPINMGSETRPKYYFNRREVEALAEYRRLHPVKRGRKEGTPLPPRGRGKKKLVSSDD